MQAKIEVNCNIKADQVRCTSPKSEDNSKEEVVQETIDEEKTIWFPIINILGKFNFLMSTLFANVC